MGRLGRVDCSPAGWSAACDLYLFNFRPLNQYPGAIEWSRFGLGLQISDFSIIMLMIMIMAGGGTAGSRWDVGITESINWTTITRVTAPFVELWEMVSATMTGGRYHDNPRSLFTGVCFFLFLLFYLIAAYLADGWCCWIFIRVFLNTLPVEGFV